MEALRRRNRDSVSMAERRTELERRLLARMHDLAVNTTSPNYEHDIVHTYAPSLMSSMHGAMTTPRISDFTSRTGLLKLGARFVGSAVISKAKKIICREVCY